MTLVKSHTPDFNFLSCKIRELKEMFPKCLWLEIQSFYLRAWPLEKRCVCGGLP